MDAPALFRQIDLFRGLAPDDLRKLAATALYRRFSKNQVLFTEGEKGAHIFVLEKGAVQLYKSTPNGREVLIKTVRQGEIFAEVVLFEQDAYPVTAAAAQSSSLYMVPKSSIHALLENGEFRNAFIGGILEKHRYLTSRLLFLSAHDSEERFKLYLKDQYGQHSGVFAALPKKSAAAAIGVTPETLSRLLLKYRKEIRWAKGEIRIGESFWRK